MDQTGPNATFLVVNKIIRRCAPKFVREILHPYLFRYSQRRLDWHPHEAWPNATALEDLFPKSKHRFLRAAWMLATNEPREAKSKPRTLKQSDVWCYIENLSLHTSRTEWRGHDLHAYDHPTSSGIQNSYWTCRLSSPPCCRRCHLDKGDFFFLISFGCKSRHVRRRQRTSLLFDCTVRRGPGGALYSFTKNGFKRG